MKRIPFYLVMIGLAAAGVATSAADGPVKLARTPEGGVQPQVALDGKGTLHMVYLKGDPKACDVMYVRREAGSAGFSAALRVNSEAGSAIAVGTIRGAQMALGRNGRVHVAWNGSGSRKAERGSQKGVWLDSRRTVSPPDPRPSFLCGAGSQSLSPRFAR